MSMNELCFEVDALCTTTITITIFDYCISAVIAKTASRNVAFKARRLRESIMEGQDSFIMREPEDVEAEFGEDSEDVVADAGNNADLYAANQGSTELINEARTEEAPLRFMDQDVFHHQPLSLD